MVELAKIMEMVLDVVKRHSSHSSEIFWRDVGDLGAMLFGERCVLHGVPFPPPSTYLVQYFYRNTACFFVLFLLVPC